MVDRATLRKLVAEDTRLEFRNAKRLRDNLVAARNQMARSVNFSNRGYIETVGNILDNLNVQMTEANFDQSLERGSLAGQYYVALEANVPRESAYWLWRPTLPINAISLIESDYVASIHGVTDTLRDQILSGVQRSLATGTPLKEIERQILGTGISGVRGRDGVFRSASFRVETIARTVTNDLINRGAIITYDQLDARVPELELQKVWQTVSDNRTSARCRSLANQVRPLDQQFQAQDGWTGDHPPSHPNCRSRVTTISRQWLADYDFRLL